ncbi:MAG: hypothetical protein NTW96_26855 [Planctomycetia bacterium]|nr:hypothetical protein [Planctomycetia bacterium]
MVDSRVRRSLKPRSAIMPNECDQPNLRVRPPRFQFTIRSMLILTAVVAVFCSVFFAMPAWAGDVAITFLVFLIPSILVTLLIYGNRDQRTFSIGALFPSGLTLLVAFGICDLKIADFHGLLPFSINHDGKLSVVLFWGVGALNGYLCVLTRRWIEKGRETEKGKTPTGTEFRA